MSYVTNCPQCKQPVSTDERVELGGKHLPLFHCPRCVERLGVGRQSQKRRLAFVVDGEGRVRTLLEITRMTLPG